VALARGRQPSTTIHFARGAHGRADPGSGSKARPSGRGRSFQRGKTTTPLIGGAELKSAPFSHHLSVPAVNVVSSRAGCKLSRIRRRRYFRALVGYGEHQRSRRALQGPSPRVSAHHQRGCQLIAGQLAGPNDWGWPPRILSVAAAARSALSRQKPSAGRVVGLAAIELAELDAIAIEGTAGPLKLPARGPHVRQGSGRV